MPHRVTSHILLTIAAAVMSILLAFFVVFNILFSDAGSFSDYASALPFVGITYFIVSYAFSFMEGEHWSKWVWWFCGPAASLAILYDLQEKLNIWLVATVVFLAITGAWSGSILGLLVRRRRQPDRPASISAKSWLKRIGPVLIITLAASIWLLHRSLASDPAVMPQLPL